MAYDFAGGFNQGQYNPHGFAGRQQGGRFAAVYGRDENGDPKPGPGHSATPTPTPPGAAPNTGMSQVGPQGDFFAQLAGLLGNQGQTAPPTTMGAGGGGYTNGPYGANAYAQEAARMQGLRDASQGIQYTTGGGQGPTGGISKEVQRGGMAGRATAAGRASSGRGGARPPATMVPKKPMRLPNTSKPTATGEVKPSQTFGRQNQFGSIGNTRKQAGGFGGRF